MFNLKICIQFFVNNYNKTSLHWFDRKPAVHISIECNSCVCKPPQRTQLGPNPPPPLNPQVTTQQPRPQRKQPDTSTAVAEPSPANPGCMVLLCPLVEISGSSSHQPLRTTGRPPNHRPRTPDAATSAPAATDTAPSASIATPAAVAATPAAARSSHLGGPSLAPQAAERPLAGSCAATTANADAANPAGR
jgi:hypothetical protein